ncbi:mannose-6-phosphate isomerase, class I [Demequina activiva]|uniref:mannose-6-phosphate isomerase n=1 Tax=Demequina activiva TaxID=1582364 RepID=A0A919Q0J1_9MICO|nr:mannose-6-phosphate isomerase, class I [Demequina activiva]
MLRDYAWGTTRDIPELLGLPFTGQPVAEAWWGAHDSAPSHADSDHGDLTLDALIAEDPAQCLGQESADRWGARLPFLLKLLAIHKPLSIQVHPTLEQAREGFAAEQRGTGGAPHQFLDPFHKPEMVYALTPMTVLAGVRPLEALSADLALVRTPGSAALADALASGNLDDYITAALAGAADERTLAALARAGADAREGSNLAVAASALEHFPGDPGAMVALALNVVHLAPGEAVYTGAGVLHSYQSGLGIEVMANSDNVVRAGLTPKRVDVPLLLRLAHTEPCPAAHPEVTHAGAAVTLTTEAEEFALTVVTDGAAEVPPGPRIVLVVQGSALIDAGGETLELPRGQAVFVPHGRGSARVAVAGTAVVAHLRPAPV